MKQFESGYPIAPMFLTATSGEKWARVSVSMNSTKKHCPIVKRWLVCMRGWFPRHLINDIDDLIESAGEISTCTEENANTIHTKTADLLSDMLHYVGLGLHGRVVKENLDAESLQELSEAIRRQSWTHSKYDPYSPSRQSVMCHAANAMHHFAVATRALHRDHMTMAESCSYVYREAMDAIWETKADNFMYRAADKLFEPVKHAMWLMVASGKGEC